MISISSGQTIIRNVNNKPKSNQLIGNVGHYLVCTELSRQGFNVMPSARNLRGVDIVGYDSEGRSFTVQVKALTKRNPVPLGKSIDHLPVDYYVIVVHVQENPIFHILTGEEIRSAVVSEFGSKTNGTGFLLKPKSYHKHDGYVNEAWAKIKPT
jgi:hypothetical protein